MNKTDILFMLKNDSGEGLAAEAEKTALARKGSHVFARGLIEFSSICRRNCLYCGLNIQNRNVERYRLSTSEIMGAAKRAAASGADTIVLQSGEGAADPGWLAEIIKEITSSLRLPVTLSVGECPENDYALWRQAGASRYLLRHETADAALYAKLHPGYSLANRLKCLKMLKTMGYETGGGFIVGLPGQSLEILAEDLLLCKSLDLDMAGVGPFIPASNSPLAATPAGNLELALRAISLLRLLLPSANLPATTALATLDPENGQTRGLKAGANVIMPNFTPARVAGQYGIYDHKTAVTIKKAAKDIEAAGRTHALKTL